MIINKVHKDKTMKVIRSQSHESEPNSPETTKTKKEIIRTSKRKRVKDNALKYATKCVPSHENNSWFNFRWLNIKPFF